MGIATVILSYLYLIFKVVLVYLFIKGIKKYGFKCVKGIKYGFKLLLKLEMDLRRKLDLKEYEIQTGLDVIKSRKLLDQMIADALLEWSIWNVRTEREGFINSKKQKECLAWVIERVIRDASPSMIKQMGIGHSITSQQELVDVVTRVAKIHVIDYTVKQNTKDMSDNIPNIYLNL